MSNEMKSTPANEDEGRRVDLHTSSGETICLSFPVNENPLPKIIQLVDPDTSQTMVFQSDKNGVYNEALENSERILNEIELNQHCQHCSCVNEEANGTSEGQRQLGDDRLEKRREKLQKKLREKKGSTSDEICSGHCHQIIQIPVQGLDQIRENSYSEDGANQDETNNTTDEEQKKIEDLKIQKAPEVEVVDSTTAKISWAVQVSNNCHLSDCKFELQSAAKNGGFKNIYSGTNTEHKETNLKPGTAYRFRLCAVKDKIRGDYSPEASAQTPCSAPSTPIPPHLANKTKTGFNIKWTVPNDNGSAITGYKLEWDQGKGDGTYEEIYNGSNRQHKLTHKLPPGTKCVFRVQALNDIGPSGFSKDLTTFTSAGVPDSPQSPSLERSGVNYLAISWTRPQCNGAEITEYLLEMEDESTGYGFMVVYRGAEQRAKVEKLKRHTSYKFRVSAINCQGSSKWSEAVMFTTAPERPARPFPPSLQGKAKTSSFSVTWDAPDDTGGTPISKFTLEMDDGKGGPFKEVCCGMETERSFDGLLPGHYYRMRLACHSEGGISEWSRIIKIRTVPVCPGQANGPILSKMHKPQPSALHLYWDPPEYTGGALISGYILEMEMEKLGVKEFREIYRGVDNMCTISGLHPGKAYSFCVRAFNEAGTGKVSRVSELSTAPGIPDAPRAPDTICRSAAAIQITWETPSSNGTPITGYTLEMMDDGTFAELYTGTDKVYELRKGICPASYYYFRVKALSAVGPSLWSTVSTCQTPAASPAGVSSIRVVEQSSTHLRMRWKHPATNGAAITSYNIEIAGVRNISFDVMNENEAEEEIPRIQEYDVTDLHPNTPYRIRVQAVNKIGCGPFSPVIIASTRDLPPPPPAIEVATISYQSLKLRWGTPGTKDAMGVTYTLDMRDDTGNFQTIFNGSTTSHKVGKLRERTEYEFRIQASNEAGTGAYSDVFTFMTTAQPPTSVKGLRADDVAPSSFKVRWEPVQSVKRGDTIEYLLQSQRVGKDQDFVRAYQGTNTCFAFTNLPTGSEYRFRACAVRQIAGEDYDNTDSPSRGLKGIFSPVVLVKTQSARRHRVSESSSRGDADEEEVELKERKPLTDTQWALIFFLGFALLALGLAFIVPLLFGVSE